MKSVKPIVLLSFLFFASVIADDLSDPISTNNNEISDYEDSDDFDYDYDDDYDLIKNEYITIYDNDEYIKYMKKDIQLKSLNIVFYIIASLFEIYNYFKPIKNDSFEKNIFLICSIIPLFICTSAIYY